MRVLRLMLCISALVLAAMPVQADDKQSDDSLEEVARTIKRLVERDFYKSVYFPSFIGKRPTDADLAKALADMNVSHTRRFLPGTIDYFEVADIYRRRLGKQLKEIFPPYGEIRYDGIGIATQVIDGKRFVTDVYDGSVAKTVGILAGDEILAVDGKPFDEIGSFKGRRGQTATISLRRKEDAAPIDIQVTVTSIAPVELFDNAINASARMISRANHTVGYVRLWTLASPTTNENVEALLTNGLLSDADGLIVDLRGRWGGLSSELPNILIEDTADISFTMRDGDTYFDRTGWRKPVVVLIDEGTRSANELLACALKKRGFKLIGTKTAGAVLGGSAYLLPDQSLLMIASAMVKLDGEVLEGKGVQPDQVVDLPIRYAAGDDPQLEAALAEMQRQLSDGALKNAMVDHRQCSEPTNSLN